MTAADKKPPTPITAAAADFQAQLEPLLKRVAQQGREIIITQDGCPLARVTPYAPQPGDPAFPVADPAAAANPVPNLGEPPILEDVIETKDRYGQVGARKRFTIKLLGDAATVSNVQWVIAAIPDRVLNPDAAPTGGKIPAPKPGEPPILEDAFEIKDADGNVVERKVFGFQIWGDIDGPMPAEWFGAANPDRPLNPDAEPAATTTDSDPEEEPPILESFINGKRFTLQVFGDIDGPMPAEWFGEVNPDRPLNPDADPAATTTDSDPEEEPPILEDVFEIKDADGNVVERKVFHFQIWGDIDGPMPAEWFGEVNPDRTLNPC